MSRIVRAFGHYLAHRVAPEVAQTACDKVAQGGSEIANLLFTGSAYSAYTAEKGSDRSHYQQKEQSQELER